jgi:hypothetical protein
MEHKHIKGPKCAIKTSVARGIALVLGPRFHGDASVDAVEGRVCVVPGWAVSVTGPGPVVTTSNAQVRYGSTISSWDTGLVFASPR